MATIPEIPTVLQNLSVQLASGDSLDVREFVVHEGLSRPFEIDIVAMSRDFNIDFEAAICRPATFRVNRPSSGSRSWDGVVAHMEQVQAEQAGVSTYSVKLVPTLWLLGQRRNYRVFQDKSELDIALELLGEWGIDPRLELSSGSYQPRRYRAQYAETDLAFVSRLLEDIGVTYFFDPGGAGSSNMVLSDAPNNRSPRAPLPFVSEPKDQMLLHEYVTSVRSTRDVKPGKYTQSDVDYRKPLDYPLAASSAGGLDVEQRLERYHHNYGSFLWKGGGGGDTPTADDRGPARTDEGKGAEQVQRRLDAHRVLGRGCSFKTTAYDLSPGTVMQISEHPRTEIGAPLLIESCTFRGKVTEEWELQVATRYTDVAYRPALSTPKPRTHGIESALVTGPSSEEIHTDEFGRVRVKFHWDRMGANDDSSSCWVPVSQPWAGAGFGGVNLPRVGQEVIVDFLGGDPDRPVVIGRVFTTTTPPPYKLPKYKMVSGLRSESYPRPKGGSGNMTMGGGEANASVVSPESNDNAQPNETAQPNEAARPNDTARRFSAGPLGGGPPLARMGEGGTGDALGFNTGNPANPGTFGAPQAAQEYLDEGIRRKQAMGPDGQDGGRSSNAVTTDDTAGYEKLYLQAQKDLRLVAKNNFTGTVGANRAFQVLGNDYEDITYFQSTTVGKDRFIKVTGKQRHEVTGDIICEGKSNHYITTKTDFSSETKEGGHSFKAKTRIASKVEKSVIMILPDAIVIDAPKVFINPGADFVSAIEQGFSATEAAAMQAKENAANEAAQKDADTLKGYGSTWTKDDLAKALDGDPKRFMSGRFKPAFDQSVKGLGGDPSNSNDMVPYAWRVWDKM